MSEQYGSHDDDILAELELQLEQDPEFCKVMEEVNDAHDLATLTATSPSLEYAGISRPYYTESINDVGRKLHKKFIKLCRKQGIDIYASDQSVDRYSEVRDMLALAAYGLKGRVWAGDILAASSALVVDMRREEDDSMGVIGISSNEKIVGKFLSPVTGPMPDEAHALVGDGDTLPPIGVGIMLGNAGILDEYGEFHADAFDGQHVIVALGTIGLELEKFHFLDEQNH